MIDDETKKTASALVNIITEKFVKPEQLEPREIDNKYETEIEYGLGQNNEKKYIGRFFKVTGTDLVIWAGYGPEPDYGFNLSFSFKKDNEQILKKVLQMYNPQKIIDGKGDSWFVVNLNVIINNTGNIQIGGEKNSQKNVSKSSTDSKSKVTDIINNAISIISSVLKAF